MEKLRRAVPLFLALLTVSRALVDPQLNTRCQAQGTCTDCIRESPSCVWCSADDIPSGNRRCNAIDRDGGTPPQCDVDLEDPASQLVGMTDDEFGPLTQVIPRRTSLQVRPGSPQVFEVQVKPANNFPIDLYLLMDLSFSMNDDLVNLKTLGTQLAQRVANVSNNFTLGFGSFVDKPLGSFINLNRNRITDPCNGGCEAPYSFRHVVDLTSDDALFSQSVNEQVISGNQDFPEGGFDGFLQSIVCTDFIGWRAVSRKIILYISDAGFHFAGDGLLGGVVKPNDGECHMMDADVVPNNDGTVDYTSWGTLDYPSIGQIAEKLEEFDIIPIFAVTRDFQDLYRLLQAEIGNRAYLGELDTDSSNVVDLVEELYGEIATSIVFSPVNVPGVSITFTLTDCPHPATMVDGMCINVQSGVTVTYDVSVNVIECTEELLAGPRTIELRVVGFGTIEVELDALCQCDCDDNTVPDSPVCMSRGELVCGVCECNPGYFGDRCQCDNTGTGVDPGAIACPTGLDGLQCSGRGTCTCGICECRTDINGQERFYGIACECDNTVCERGIGNEICSGPSRGECTCDGCQCLPEPVTGQLYTMSDCSCTPNTQTCSDPTNSTTNICNGRGLCECGRCISCDSPWFGDFCERCSGDPICQQRRCDEDGDNALCVSCTIDLLDELFSLGVGIDIFTPEIFDQFMENSTLLTGSNTTMVMSDDIPLAAIELPESFSAECGVIMNASCTRFLIVNDTFGIMDYNIEDTGVNDQTTPCTVLRNCTYTYYVSVDDTGEFLPIHVGYPPVCPVTTTSTSTGSDNDLPVPPWAIALIIIGILLVLALLLFLLLKILLLLLDYIEVKKFEDELAKMKYTKNENPLYHSATKDYKNPIYGQ